MTRRAAALGDLSHWRRGVSLTTRRFGTVRIDQPSDSVYAPNGLLIQNTTLRTATWTYASREGRRVANTFPEGPHAHLLRELLAPGALPAHANDKHETEDPEEHHHGQDQKDGQAIEYHLGPPQGGPESESC